LAETLASQRTGNGCRGLVRVVIALRGDAAVERAWWCGWWLAMGTLLGPEETTHTSSGVPPCFGVGPPASAGELFFRAVDLDLSSLWGVGRVGWRLPGMAWVANCPLVGCVWLVGCGLVVG
jgi:hypothetical protein